MKFLMFGEFEYCITLTICRYVLSQFKSYLCPRVVKILWKSIVS